MSETTRILGIDPGLNRTGFGVIDAVGGKLTVVTAGCIRIPAGDLSERLGTIYRSLSQIIEETKPTVAAAEIVFVNINPRSTLLLGQARGAALTCAAVHNLRVHEFTPSEIKQSAVGTGRATKEQVQIEKLLQAIEKNPFATQAYYAEQIGVSKRTVSRIFVSLQQNGVLVQNGTNRKSIWVIIK